MARPRKTAKRKEQMHIRCTTLEKLAIQRQAQHAGLSDAEYIRSAALRQKISYKLTPEEIEIYKWLTLYRNNFKHISNLIKNKQEIQGEVLALVAKLDRHLKKFRP